jgi:hypothetical protein
MRTRTQRELKIGLKHCYAFAKAAADTVVGCDEYVRRQSIIAYDIARDFFDEFLEDAGECQFTPKELIAYEKLRRQFRQILDELVAKHQLTSKILGVKSVL